jgi:phosphatidate cytidylyltransferase
MATRRFRDRRGRRRGSQRPPQPPTEFTPPSLRIRRGDQTGPLVDQAEDLAGPAPTPRPTRRSETLARIGWAVPWIVFAILIVVVGELAFTLAMVGLAWIGLAELFRMTARAKPFVPVGFAVAAALIVAAHYGTGRTMGLAVGAAVPLMFVFALSRPSLKNVTYSMAITIFAIAWIAAPFAHAVLLRDLPDHGAALLVNVLVATFAADTAAYAAGRLFGSRQLAPKISPNKTIEGLMGGFIGGTMGFWFAGLYQDWLTGADALLMGACVAILAPLGDLFESMVKRDLDVKDSGRAFGPHGGLLDRLDAVLFTVVAGYYLSVALVY